MPHAICCRSCGNTSLNSLVKWERPTTLQAQPGGPLTLAPKTAYGDELVFCPQCTLVQRIINVGSAIPSSHERASLPVRPLVTQIIASQKLRPTSLVIDIGSREGRLLADYRSAGIPVLGVEPAVRLAEIARRENHIPTLPRWFDAQFASLLAGCNQLADVVHLSHALPYVENLDSVAAGVATLLKPSGVAVIDTPDVKQLLDRRELCSPLNAELSYFSLTSLATLFARQKLVIYDAERLTDNDGTLRLFLGKHGQSSPRVTKLLTEEQHWGVAHASTYFPTRQIKVA